MEGVGVSPKQFRGQGKGPEGPGSSQAGWAGRPRGARGSTSTVPTPMLWEAGERPGSACAIEVEGLKRRPPT